jgi:hypothetical protein
MPKGSVKICTVISYNFKSCVRTEEVIFELMKCQTLNHNLQKKLRGNVEITTMISYIFESHVRTKQVLF